MANLTSSVAEKANVVPNLNNELASEKIKKLVKEHSLRLLKTGFFQENQREDLEQEFLVVLWKESHHYNSLHGSFVTFAKTVLKNRTKNRIVKETRRQKNAPQMFDSLDIVINEDQDTVGDLIDSDTYEMDVSGRVRPLLESLELIECKNYAISKLPPHLQEFCHAILSGDSISSFAKKKKVSRAAIAKYYIAPIRAVFVREGLREFCGGLHK